MVFPPIALNSLHVFAKVSTRGGGGTGATGGGGTLAGPAAALASNNLLYHPGIVTPLGRLRSSAMLKRKRKDSEWRIRKIKIWAIGDYVFFLKNFSL